MDAYVLDQAELIEKAQGKQLGNGMSAKDTTVGWKDLIWSVFTYIINTKGNKQQLMLYTRGAYRIQAQEKQQRNCI